jgi:hypothetical protein
VVGWVVGELPQADAQPTMMVTPVPASSRILLQWPDHGPLRRSPAFT